MLLTCTDVDGIAGNLREICRDLAFYCSDCLEIARQPVDPPEPPQIPQKLSEVGLQAELDTWDCGNEVLHEPLYKSICAPIYELKKKHVSV